MPSPSLLHKSKKKQVGSSDSPNISTDPNDLASDLRELADLLAPHGYRLAYENWCWATVAPTWSSVYEIVKLVDRPNIGLCLDTFQTVGSEYADPNTSSGLISTEGIQAKLEQNWKHSLATLTKTVPKEKIYLLQISDAYRPKTPLEDKVSSLTALSLSQVPNPSPTFPSTISHSRYSLPGPFPLTLSQEIDGLRPRGRWSHDFRPYPYNGGAYTQQCVDFATAVLKTGSRCWFSVEVFDGGADGKGKDYEMGEFCEGAMASVKRLLDECADS